MSEKIQRSTIGTDLIESLLKSKASLKCKTEAQKLLKKYAGIDKEGNISTPGGVFAVNNNKTLTAICAAGLGNRICTLIDSVYWSHKLNFDLQIYWDIDTCCNCSYSSLFSTYSDKLVSKNTFIDHFINNLTVQEGAYPEAIIENINKIKLSDLQDYEYLLKTLPNYNTIFLNKESVPSYIDKNNITDILSTFKIDKNIVCAVKSFIDENSISQKDIGMHIRKIDPPEIASGRFFIPIDHYINIIKNNPDQSYFVCSDNKEIEELCSKYPNVKMLKKNSYIKYDNEKAVTLRDESAVIEGFIDMLILSKTNILPLSLELSSFCKSAYYFSDVQF